MSNPVLEPEIGGVLGRAIARARSTGERPEEGRPRDEFPCTTADLLASPLGALGVLLFVACSAAVIALFWNSWYGMVLALGALVIAFWGAGEAARWRLGPGLGIAVGTDGVLVRGTFIPYHRIRSVVTECRRYRDDDTGAANNLWIVSLVLVDGDRVRLRQGVAVSLRHPGVTEVANAVEEARAAWLAAHRGPGDEEDLFARGDRTSAEWVDALRRLGSGSSGVYRVVNADVEQVSRLLDDPRAAPSARAAAAVVLAACGDGTAGRRLRIAAGAMANPRLRIALEKVASAEDDAALAEALDAVVAEDRGPGARGRAGAGGD